MYFINSLSRISNIVSMQLLYSYSYFLVANPLYIDIIKKKYYIMKDK